MTERTLRDGYADACIDVLSPELAAALDPAGGRQRLAVRLGRTWPNGSTLRVAFLDGNDDCRRLVRQVACEWTEFANLDFVFPRGRDGDIRVTFTQHGYWSRVGTDAKKAEPTEPTMNLGGLVLRRPDRAAARAHILHEFGHAIGAVHEHSQPNVQIRWNTDAIYSMYMGPPNNFTRAEVDKNFFERYNHEQANGSAFDPESIMLYPIPRAHTLDGFEVKANLDLSPTDKAFISEIYPTTGDPVTYGPGDSITGFVARGQINEYPVVVRSKGTYRFTTVGGTPTRLAVSDANGNPLGSDHGSGTGQNGDLSMELDAGSYGVAVQHRFDFGSGRYELRIEQAE